MQWNLGPFEHSSNANRELATAIVALLEPKALLTFLVLHAVQCANTTRTATFRANGTVRPDDGL